MLDVVPDPDRLREAFDRASRIVLRLRQHVVVPALPVGAAEWITDPDFDLDFHLRRFACLSRERSATSSISPHR